MKAITLLALMTITLTGFSQAPTLPLDFESTSVSYLFEDFSGGATTVIPNPQSSGINTSATVAQMVKGVGDPWGGSFIDLSSAMDFTEAKTFRMKIYAPRVGARVLLKVEDSNNGANFFELEQAGTLANAWEELVFDFRYIDLVKSYDRVVLIFDLGVVGDGSANFTFLFDDIQLLNEGPYPSQLDLPVTFDDPTVDYTMIDFEGGYSEIVTDPTDGGNTVAKSVKKPTSGSSAGTTVGTNYGFATAIPITATATKMSVRVYSPKAGIPVRLKIETAGDPTRSVETQVNTTLANQWEGLEFDFMNEATGTAALNLSYIFNKASIFFHFGTDGNGVGADSVFYWDDLTFGDKNTLGMVTAAELGLTFFPNPATERVTFQSTERLQTIQLLNQLGQEMKMSTASGYEMVLDLNGLPAGLYLAKVWADKGSTTVRIVKE